MGDRRPTSSAIGISAQRRLAAELSERMGVPVVALALEEDAVVRFLLFERGRMVDEYLSVPTYYGDLNEADELSLSANATLVARLTGADPAKRARRRSELRRSPSELATGPRAAQNSRRQCIEPRG